ncbi:hypothetical protein M431DRAFT_230418 [Trichoderma harzianum CBS 226.95]|uniref:Uncharacterized protein n=1 Tax=Trichoderma harzianum CBS 226.95 TaxID=983964 RepID=A0A2T4A4F2_TRIHA|nr:hypothetical protein M431DRAFT_230418 [Trichoderma harzianum CBS 226.95]PTB51957.1 hypothetical protein M431DRAFT_230418 [Trichoderma harzianum CBS 226.95]
MPDPASPPSSISPSHHPIVPPKTPKPPLSAHALSTTSPRPLNTHHIHYPQNMPESQPKKIRRPAFKEIYKLSRRSRRANHGRGDGD